MATLVTGAAGFIGFHTARALLARGEAVIGVDSFVPYYRLDLNEARDHGFRPTTPIDVGVPAFVDWYRSWTAARS